MRTVLVTGASRGIGRAIAADLARDSHVLVGASTLAAATATADALGSNATPFPCDLVDPHDSARAVAAADLDRLDALVHSAGVLVSAPVAQLAWSDWQRSFAINVFAAAELTRLLLPAVRAARGTVVTINSGSGLHSGPGQAVYAGTKHALTAFTDALRAEEAGRVRVTSIHPGRVDTDMQRQLRAAEGEAADDYDGTRWARPESVARAVRLAVDLPADASVPMLRVTPSGLES